MTISLTEYGLSFALSGLRIKSSLPIYISTDGSFVYPKLFPVSLLYYCIVYVNLIKDRSFVTPPFFRKAVAKVRSFSHILQIFAELFSKFFFGARLRGSLLKSGCKGKELFSNCQMFCEVFFRKFFSKASRSEGTVRLGLSCERRDRKTKILPGDNPQSICTATACQASPLRFRKRVQKYGLSPDLQTYTDFFFTFSYRFYPNR